MKKILLPLMIIFLSACSLTMNESPRQKVSAFLDSYKNQDSTVLSQLEETINNEYTNDDYRQRYKTLMTNQYKNMAYEIKDEQIEGDNAVVEVEITVYDYASAIRKANDYLNSNPDIFKKSNPTIDMEDAKDETTKDISDSNNQEEKEKNITQSADLELDEDKFMEYKLTQMESVNDMVKYTIEFTLTKTDGKWKIDPLSNADIEKLHGIYNQD